MFLGEIQAAKKKSKECSMGGLPGGALTRTT